MKKDFIKIFIALAFLQAGLSAQTVVNTGTESLNLQPVPKLVSSLKKSIVMPESVALPVIAYNDREKKAAQYLSYIIEKQFGNAIISLLSEENNIPASEWKIRIQRVNEDDNYKNDQYYSINCSLIKKEIKISSSGQLGLLYGCSSFLKFIEADGGNFRINLFNITDWPSYIRREISAVMNNENSDEILNFALLNKYETVAIASRMYPWYRTDSAYNSLLIKIKEWKDKFGGPSVMQMHNIYDGRKIEISNNQDVDSLWHTIETGIKSGIDKLLILADDTPPFEFGEGYVLTSENDKKMFRHMADAHCYLLKEIEKRLKLNSYYSEFYYGPAFYTYEDMYYGNMNLYKNTQWEKNAYDPLKRDLNFIGKNMPKDVFVLWTGPNVRSRKITNDDLKDWTKNLSGRLPFLWDNTIYSHYPFTSTPLFSAYENDIPKDFYKKTAGNGMFINGDAGSEDSKVALITTADYLWNPEKYNPQKSLNVAMENYYGKELVPLLLKFKEAELGLRTEIGARRLWFESDSLWSVIRKIRFITEKNPLNYHLNYNGLKAFRMQAKYSVSKPAAKELFIEKCISLDKKRNEAIEKIKLIDGAVAERIKKIMIPVPDLNMER